MPLGPGVRLGPYEIVAAIGAGGMGEVYRARDTRLDRTVAIKILPAPIASDQTFRERFDREARAVAALNHPHICTLYDIGDEAGTAFLVMEYLEGETLADRLAKGALPLDQALRYAIQIAEALDKAHRAGIVHRDLKPGNIMLTKSGAKLLDFGLAKSGGRGQGAAGSLLSFAPTAHAPVTAQGTILGTLQYMAPEQVEGREADTRSDIFAFGAVVYEMVTGKRAFEGKSQASVIAAILDREPPAMSSLQPLTPAALDHIVQRCLAKDRDERWQTASDSLRELRWAATSAHAASGPSAASRTTRSGIVPIALVVTFIAVAIAGTWYFSPRSEAPLLTRLDVATPPTTDAFSFALAPNGRSIAFVANGPKGIELWLRRLDQTRAQPLDGTVGAMFPFWSPDSRDIGFFADGKLKRVNVDGGGTRVLADAATARGGTWNRDGVIVFGQASPGALMQVSASGSVPSAATKLAAGQNNHRWPQFLPDGNHMLFFVQSGDQAVRGIYVGALSRGEPVRLAYSDEAAWYAPPGYLLRVVQGTLLAQPFDPVSLSLSGEATAVGSDVGIDDSLYRSAFSVSAAGVLAHRTASASRRQLAWLDRTGKTIENVGAVDDTSMAGPQLSPDDSRVAMVRTVQGNSDVWLIDLRRNVETRFTFDPAIEDNPVWSPDGTRIAFRSLRSAPAIFDKPVDGSSGERRLVNNSNYVVPHDWSSDGGTLLYSVLDPETQTDIWAIPLAGDRKAIPVVQSKFDDGQEQFSPDGRWVAYASNESGRYEVYVVPFPPGGGKWQISTAGGTSPRWRRDGNELYYVDPDNRLVAASIQTTAGSRTLNVGVPKILFQTRLATGANIFVAGANSRAQYDVAADGRFLMNVQLDDEQASPINVVLNWQEELKQRVPTR